MNETEFFYWLQGFFELSGPATLALSDSQIDCITKHDRLVAASGGSRCEQMIKIAVMLELIRDHAVDRTKGTEAVRRMVAHQFQHVIDPKAGPAEQQEKLNEAHGPPTIGGSGPSGTMFRC